MSVFSQARAALTAASESLNCAEILELCDEAQNTTEIAQAMFAMGKTGEALREGERGSFRYRINPKYAPSRKRPGETEAPAPAPKRKYTTRAAQPKAAPKKRRARRPPSSEKPARAGARQPREPGGHDGQETPATLSDFGVGINDAGHLGLSKGDVKLDLDPAEFARLRTFIERTDTLWSVA